MQSSFHDQDPTSQETARTTSVIGASGFIGKAVTTALAGAGRDTAAFTRALPFAEASGALDPVLLRSYVVFWLASSICPATATTHPDAVSADVQAFEVLLDGLADQRLDLPRVICVSSGGTVYDAEHPPPHDETTPTRSANSYGEAMLSIEDMLRKHCPDHVVIRATNVYGPGQLARRGQGVIAHWMRAMLDGAPLHLIGDPATRRDYLYITDLVDAVVRCTDAPSPPHLVNIGSGAGTSLEELLTLIEQAAGRTLNVHRSPARVFDAPSTWLDVTRAQETLGWTPSTTLPAGLAKTLAAMSRRP
jgi:UDP-glucose 4-epimerase